MLHDFLVFLDQVQTESSSQIYNTLLELYLHDMAHETEKRPRLELERKAMALLQTGEVRIPLVGIKMIGGGGGMSILVHC